jgi:anti-anti-sigma regulatory factor
MASDTRRSAETEGGDGIAGRLGSFSLPPTLGFAEARALRDSIAAMLGDKAGVDLEASSVERMSTPCAQVLLAAGRSAAAVGGFRIVNASEAFCTALADLGLQAEFRVCT